MKTYYSCIITVCIIVLIGIVSCDENKEADGYAPLVLTKTEHLGCFVDNPAFSSKCLPADTLYYTISNNVLTLSAVLNYNCCGLLSDSVVTDGNDVQIYISDTCTQNCLCDCICDFKFEYRFTGFLEKIISFKVYLKGLEEGEYTLWKETAFIDGID